MTRGALALIALAATACTGAHASSFLPAPAGAHRGGTVTVAISTPGSVDPGNDYEPAGDLVVRTMCDALLTTDPRTGALRSGLAESWVVTDSGAKVVLRLRKGLRFSDGSPLTATDVVFSLSRVASADYASALADRLSLVAGYPEIHGDKETDNDAARRRLAGVTAPDRRTVEITLSRPYADFVRVLATPLTAPVSEAAAQRAGRGFDRSPVCAGPYRLASPYTPGDRELRLVRSKAYLPADPGLTGGGIGYADEVLFRISPDAAAAAASSADVVPARPADRAVQQVPGPLVEYLGLPVKVAPFDRPEVRRALALALSRTELVRRVFPTTRIPGTGFLPPTTGAARSCDALPPDGDPTAAQALLHKAGVDLTTVRVPLLFNDELRNRALVTEVARQWRAALGLVATPTPMAYDDFLARGRSARGFESPFRFSWAATDVDSYLTPLFTSDAIGRDNLSRFSDPSVDEALAKRAWRATDAADRALAYGRIAGLLCTDMPMVPLTTTLARFRIATSVGSAAGGYLDASTGQPLLRELYRR